MDINKVTPAQLMAKLDARSKEGFDTFMADPITKFMVSLVPPAETPDLVPTLLEAAFRAGAGCGQVSMAISLMEKLHN